MTTPRLEVLRAAGVCVVLDVAGPLLPRVVHWGADLGPLEDGGTSVLAASVLAATQAPVPRSALDAPWPLTLLPVEDDGWSGHPGVQGHREGGSTALRLRLDGTVRVDHLPAGGGSVLAVARDGVAGVRAEVTLRLDAHGVLHWFATLGNEGSGLYDVATVRALLPLPARAGEVLDLTGRWCRERSPQRSRLQHGTHLRASRRGRTGHDATGLMCAGTVGFGFRYGEVWAAHVAWSGDHEHLVEVLPEGAGGAAAVLGGGELLRAGEVRLAPGQSYSTPEVVLVWSEAGLDGLSDRLHASVRARPGHPSGPRPLVLNTWEAVYFGTDTEHLMQLADTAADIGVERFVLDDGWFGGRRDDTRALGDWVVSDEVWPHGLHPLAERVRSHGMQLGLWFEPEMVNPDSDLLRSNPGWLLAPEGGSPRLWRFQQALDLTLPAVRNHLLERISSLVSEYGLDFLKWDHNRDLHTAVTSSQPGGRTAAPDRPAVHEQTLGLYALLDALRERHPGLEIESCASGGARIDLGIAGRTDRVWTSDCNDALERQTIQRWTTLLLPPEMCGTHVGPPLGHTTHRMLDLSFRCVTALFGHAGLEWDITTCSPAELDVLRAWAGLYREVRPLLHTGRVVRADLPDDSALLHGVVDEDRAQALFAYVRLTTSPEATPGRVLLPGLDPAARYRLRLRTEAGEPATVQADAPGWWSAAVSVDGFAVDGAVLSRIGLAMPVLAPAQAALLHLALRP